MFSPPFTPLKVIIIAVMAIAIWAFLIWRIRDNWVQRRRKREVLAEGGVRSSPRRLDRRNVFLIIVVGAVLLVALWSVYIDQHGSLPAKVRLHEVEWRIKVFMKHFMMGVLALVGLFFLLLWWNRDPAVRAAAKLTQAGRHAEAEAMIRKRIEAKGPSEQRLTVLGLVLSEQNRLEEALQHLQEARRLARRPASAMNNCADVLWKLGCREEAAQLFEEACKRAPNDFGAACNCCLALAQLGREAQARERLQQAEQIFVRYDLRYTKTWVPLLEECRKAVPPAQGFPVVLPKP